MVLASYFTPFYVLAQSGDAIMKPLLVTSLCALCACASQGLTHINAGDYRVSGASGGAGYATWDDEFYEHDAGAEASIQAGRMITDQFEFGLDAVIGLGVGSGDANESFSFALDPGIYGRYYISPLGGGFTPWINVGAMFANAIHTGVYDNNFDTIFVVEINVGATTFIADRLAIEYSVFLGGYIDDGTYSNWVDLTDVDALLFSFGLSFYF